MRDSCVCQTVSDVGDAVALDALADVRAKCPALSNLVLPDSVWPDFREWHRQPDEVALHRSVTLLALERGCLSRVTSPLHCYLLDGDSIRPDVRQQYISDLRERWMQYPDPTERHQKSRIFRGRLVELQYAEWLEANGKSIGALEARGGVSDIETVSADGSKTGFEVKFIGSEDGDFSTLLKAIAGKQAASVVSPYAAINYLLFRAYEGAKQLAKVNGGRVVTVIVDDITWDRFQMQLEHGWIDWSKPQFIGEHTGWQTFLAEQRRRHDGLPGELATVLQGVDAVWILRQSSRFEFSVAYKYAMHGA